MARETPGSQTVERALSVLDALLEQEVPMRQSELAQVVGLNISTLSRLLASLERYNYVVRDPDTGRYRLSYKLLQMARVVQEQAAIPDLAQPILAQLMEATAETATVNVLHNDQAMTIARIECTSPLRIVSQIGNRNPLYCTAAGKTLLAYLPEHEVDRILAPGMPRLTPNTITTPEAMKAELARVRERGFAVDLGEREEGLIGIGAPVRDASGTVVAECGVSGSAQRMQPERVPELAERVVEAADLLSERLGWRAPVRREATAQSSR